MIQRVFNFMRSALVYWLQTDEEKEGYQKLVERCQFLESELAQMRVEREQSEAAYYQLHQRCEDLEKEVLRLLREAESLRAYCYNLRPEVSDHLKEVLSRPEEIRWIKEAIRSQAEDWVRYLEFHFEVS